MSQLALVPEKVYHVYTHANGFENLFYNEDNYHYFLRKYEEYILPIGETYAYCLMPNHIHFMIKIRSEKEILEYLRLKRLNKLKEQGIEEEESADEKRNLQNSKNLGGISANISKQFSNLFNAYTKAINKKLNRKGSLFTPNFKRKEINDDRYMKQLIAYIHKNPVHHGFTSKLTDWPYCSYHNYISEERAFINCQYMYDWFGSKELFVDFHKKIQLPVKLVLD